jgi:hypothetical protein
MVRKHTHERLIPVTSDYEDEDEYCPHCDNHYVLEAVEPEASLGVEGEDIRIDSRYILIFFF